MTWHGHLHEIGCSLTALGPLFLAGGEKMDRIVRKLTIQPLIIGGAMLLGVREFVALRRSQAINRTHAAN